MRSRAATLATLLLAAMPLAGCYQGFDDTVNTQGPTGNGTDISAGPDLKVQDATLVLGSGGDASLVLALINEGEVDEALQKVTVADAGRATQDGPIKVRSGTATLVGGEAPASITVSDLKVPAGSWADVTMQFERAGTVTTPVAVVPATGYYEPFGPGGAKGSKGQDEASQAAATATPEAPAAEEIPAEGETTPSATATS